MRLTTVSRRGFLAGAAAVGGATRAASYRRIPGANDRINVGVIGYGLIGKRHVLDLLDRPDAAAVAVAEVHAGRRDEAAALIGGAVAKHPDFRSLLDDPAVDAVVVSTPDHWHALMAMMACDAGKDVYVEKPLTVFPREGRWLVDVAGRTGRVVQVGTQQRSGGHYQRARELIRGGHIGKVVSVRMGAARNIGPGYGSPPDCEPPPGLDYDLWLGPAPERPYNPHRCIYHFRWFWDYSGGQMTNLGQHQLDIVDWCLGVGGPATVAAVGGRYALTDDNGETPDTMDAVFGLGDWSASWSHREGSGGDEPRYGLEFYGTNGSLGIDRSGFVVTADRRLPPPNTVPHFAGAHPVGGPVPVPVDGDPPLRTAPIEDRTGDSAAQLRDHIGNFLDCIRTRETPASDLASGHRVATLCHLANIALRLGRSIRWDGDAEHVVGDTEAEAMLERPYRAPWDAELRALLRS